VQCWNSANEECIVSGPLEIICPACGEEALVKREPVYEGFKKVGEKRSCSACGAELPDEDSLKPAARPSLDIFSDEDRPEAPSIFSEDERQKCCRYCAHYVVNPFTQRCGLHERDVESTDLCFDFERAEDEDAEDSSAEDGED
jgi:hypothetical protein